MGRRSTAAAVGGAVAGAAVAGVVAWFASGRHLELGANAQESVEILPGDELVPDATLTATRAIDIDAPVDYVWPWIAQLGQDKAGFYSHSWLENLAGSDVTNAGRIVPQWQHPQVGDAFPLHPNIALRVALVDEPHALVVCSPQPEGANPPSFDFGWAFVVRAHESGRGSRLLVRERYRARGAGGGYAVQAAAAASTPMTLSMLRGIRGRAETLVHSGV